MPRLAEVLTTQGVPFLFTLCGGHISPILVAAKARGIRVIDTRHEATAVFAADASSEIGVRLGALEDLGRSESEELGLRVFVGQGYYDFATPFFGAEYSLNRTGIPNDGRISWHWYNAGHMMYVRDEDLRKLSNDIRAIIKAR